MPHACARCAFGDAIRHVVHSGTYIAERGHLSRAERRIVALCEQWLAEDTIRRCLDEAGRDS